MKLNPTNGEVTLTAEEAKVLVGIFAMTDPATRLRFVMAYPRNEDAREFFGHGPGALAIAGALFIDEYTSLLIEVPNDVD